MNTIIEKNLKEIKSSFWSFFIRKRSISWIIVLAIIAFGSYSYFNLPRELQPEVNIPIGVVSTALPGANPIDTESLITEPLEEKIATIDNIKTLSSNSGFGNSSILVEFEAEADLDKSIQDLKDAVDLAKNELPEDAIDPMVIKTESNTLSIITFSVVGDLPLYELTRIAEEIQPELEKINGVSNVEIIGDQKSIIEIKINPQKAENYNLDIQTIADIIKFNNYNLPIGIISTDKINYSARIDNRFQTLEEIRNLPLLTIPNESNTSILLRDIAEINETYPEESVISKLSTNGKPSEKTVSLRVFKKDQGDILKIAKESKKIIEDLKENYIPKNIKIEVSNDNSKFIQRDLGILTKNGLQTTALIIFILFLALGFKEGLLAGLSIPLTFLVAFSVMQIQDMTINSLSLFSLVIALGLMVDTAIVIMEGIHENMKKGLSSKDSAMLSVYTYKWPLIAGTMTTIFAFFPMLLVSGIMGEFLKTLPITISAALFGSLFVSLTIGPAVASKFLSKRKTAGKKSSPLEPLFNYLGKIFHNFIYKIIEKKRYRAFIIIIALFSFLGSLSLPISGVLKTELFPKTDIDYFIIDIETPSGTILAETQKVVENFEEKIYDIPEIDNFLTIIGSSQALAYTDIVEVGGSTKSNQANITINLIDESLREKRSYEIADEIRKKCEKFPNAKISIRELSEGPPTESPVTARITGQDLDVLQNLASEVKKIMQNTNGTQNIETSLQQGLAEFKFSLDRDILNYHGLSAVQVAGTIRNIVQGVKATNIKLREDDIDIYVKYDLKTQNNTPKLSIDDLENFEINSPKGYSINLGQLGEYSFDQSLSSISREDQDRIIKVTSDIKAGANSVTVTAEVQDKVNRLNLESGYNISFGGDLEEIAKSFQELYVSMGVGLLLIAFTLVLMFNSFRQPLIIILTLPLALIGVFPGLMAIGLNFSFPAFLGVVALAGIVVNDSIVLIDRININRKNDIEFSESIAEAAKARMQPIFMTSITTIVGILPLALTNEFWSGLGFALIFGLAFSTALTLIVIPVLYFIFEIRKERKKLMSQGL